MSKKTDIQECMALLDSEYPGWRDIVDISKVKDLADPDGCILSQIGEKFTEPSACPYTRVITHLQNVYVERERLAAFWDNDYLPHWKKVLT